MSSPDCGVLSSRGWTGGLCLSVASPNTIILSSPNAKNLPSPNNTKDLSLSDATNANILSNMSNIPIPNDANISSNISESAAVLSPQAAPAPQEGPNDSCYQRRGRASPAPLGRVPLVRRRARRCRFYRNGDRWFPGSLLAVSSDRHRTWDALLEDVTRLLEHPLHLAAGVRYVFTLQGSKIEVLEQLSDSGEYVASSTDAFKTIDYRAARLPPQWRLHTRRREALHVQPSAPRPGQVPEAQDDAGNKARLVTVIRNGQRPRKAIRFLLNSRTARALEQVMEDLSCSLKLDTGAVRKIYTLDGRQVMTLRELFQDDDVFIAYGHERCSRDDFFLDNEEKRSIQPLLKGSVGAGTVRRMPSPKPRGRTTSPLPAGEHTGSLPRGSRLSRESPSNMQQPLSSQRLPPEIRFLPPGIASRYRVGRVLGDGNFAIVRECEEISTKRKFALKIINKWKCLGKEDMIHSEVDILRKVNHSNIVRLEKEVDSQSYLYLVMELITGGDLFDAIAAATRYTELEAGNLIRDLVSALEYLHERNIVHRDVKPENLLVVPGPMPRLKLGDFGLAVQLTEPLYTICGTPTYVAPEILAEHGYGLEVDIWAAGVIAYILLCGFPPFISLDNIQEELFEQILAGHLSFPSPYWDHVSPEPRHLIAAMVMVNPRDRFQAYQVLQHPWIKANNEQIPSDVVSNFIVPPPSSSDEDNHLDYGQRVEYDHQEMNYNQVEFPITPAGGGGSPAKGESHQSNKSPDHSNNSVSSSSGIDSYGSSNDNKYNDSIIFNDVVANNDVEDNKQFGLLEQDGALMSGKNNGNTKQGKPCLAVNPRVRTVGDGSSVTSEHS